MLTNLVKYSLKSFRRRRSYLIINVLGLSIGIACSLMILLFVINELSFDRFNTKKERIYRLVMHFKMSDQEFNGSWSAPIMGPAIVKEFPEIEDFLRMTIFNFDPVAIEYNNQKYTEKNLIQADSSFFNFFSVPLLRGDPKNLLNAPRQLVISESAAKKIFGIEDPVNKTLKVGEDSVLYTISGIMADIPENSHFAANMISSFMTNPRSKDQTWSNNSVSTYLLIRQNSKIADIEKKMIDLIMVHCDEEIRQYMGLSMADFLAKGNKYGYSFQNLKDIHLDQSIRQEFKEAGNPKYLIIMGSLAVLILIIATINFMNLSTAQASGRARDVGIKKIGGSPRWILIAQFLTESYVLAVISLIFALVLVKSALPYLNKVLGADLDIKLFGNGYIVPVLIIFSLVVGFLSGAYPAFYLSSFNPSVVLKGGGGSSTRNATLRRILVVFQFTVSIMLIIGTMVMYRQLRYMLNKDPGFKKEQLLVINRKNCPGTMIRALKEDIKNIPGVIQVVSSSTVPGRNNNNNGYSIEGREDEKTLMWTNYVDYNFIETYGMKLIAGRNFDESYTTDAHTCIINESAILKYGITDFEHTRIIRPGDSARAYYMRIIGVVKNFNSESLHNPIQPYIFRLENEYSSFGYLTVKISAENYSKTITGIETIWKEYTSDKPLDYYFLDDGIKRMYLKEKQTIQMAVIFSILAIFIAALGLFGLTSYTVEQRTREIGIRKAMGSSVSGIYLEISKEVIILISVSALIALPVIYFITNKWLENFYFRISSGPFTFIGGFVIVLAIAVLTITYRVLSAARVNPARSLKYE